VWLQQAEDPLRVLIAALNKAGSYLVLPEEREQVLELHFQIMNAQIIFTCEQEPKWSELLDPPTVI